MWKRWKGLLALAVVVSIGLNVAHAYMTANVGAALVASIPPLFLFWITHNTVTAPDGAKGWREDRVGIGSAAAVALGAFTVSYITQRDLALLLGLDWVVAMILPLIVDLTIAVASYKLVREAEAEHRASAAAQGSAEHDAASAGSDVPALRETRPAEQGYADRETPAPDTPAVHRDTDSATQAMTSNDSRETATEHVETTQPLRRLAAVPPTARSANPHVPASRTTPVDAAEASGDAHLIRAQRLVETGRTTQPVDVVHAVLRGLAGGRTVRDTADAAGLTTSSVQRIAKAARDLAAA
jgi:hypothetical protein